VRLPRPLQPGPAWGKGSVGMRWWCEELIRLSGLTFRFRDDAARKR
jgi:hypothetical protein